MNILQAIDDPQVFAPWFERGEWQPWRAFLAALFGLPLEGDDWKTYRRCTKRHEAPQSAAEECWLIIGRRGGKSFMLALTAVFLAAFRDYRPYLQPGERATVMILAADKRQSRVIFRYVDALLTRVPMLARIISNRTAEGIDLDNGVSIEIHAASFRGTRGYTLAAVCADEVAFWRSDESANPDKEILNALRPGMATIPGAMLLAASSPYARKGALHDAWKRHFGKDGDPVLVWQADTRTMNPTVPKRVIEQAYQEDPQSAAAEYGAEFRRDIESFAPPEVVDACVIPGRHDLPPIGQPSGPTYRAFVDPSGGAQDGMTLAIAHTENKTTVVDAIRERTPPFNPDEVVRDFADLLRRYRVGTVRGDRYAGEWPRERFRAHGIGYQPATKAKSDLYRDMLPALTGGRIELPDSQKLRTQIVSLERRTGRGGRDTIDHPPGGHDDLVNAVAGVVEGNRGKRAGAL